MNPLESLARVLAAPQESAALQACIAANPISISFDTQDPATALRTDTRTGIKEHGRVDAAGLFTPIRPAGQLS